MVKSILTIEQLQKLPTKRLLAYKKKLWETKLPNVDYHDYFSCTCSDCKEDKKKYELRNLLIERVKTVLATREHVERKKDLEFSLFNNLGSNRQVRLIRG